MAYSAPPARTEISDTYPNPSNAVARVGFGKLWDYVTGLLGSTGNPAAAITALGAVDTSTAQAVGGIKTFSAQPVFNGGISLGTNGQIVFPATQNASANANTLDDYEEGTFTPSFITDGTQPSASYGSRVGDYVKVGRMVYVSIYIETTRTGGTGSVYISGLPFVAGSGLAANSTSGSMLTYSVTATGNNQIVAWLNNGSSSLSPWYSNLSSGGNWSQLTIGNTPSGSLFAFRISLCYTTAN